MKRAVLDGATKVLPRYPDPCDVFLGALHSTHGIPGYERLASLRGG